MPDRTLEAGDDRMTDDMRCRTTRPAPSTWTGPSRCGDRPAPAATTSGRTAGPTSAKTRRPRARSGPRCGHTGRASRRQSCWRRWPRRRRTGRSDVCTAHSVAASAHAPVNMTNHCRALPIVAACYSGLTMRRACADPCRGPDGPRWTISKPWRTVEAHEVVHHLGGVSDIVAVAARARATSSSRTSKQAVPRPVSPAATDRRPVGRGRDRRPAVRSRRRRRRCCAVRPRR